MVVTVGGVASNGVSFTVTSATSVINYASGFTGTGMNFVGSAKLSGTSLELTPGGGSEAGAAWYGVEANIQSFVTDFTFLVSAGTNTADGFTFTLQGNNTSAIGQAGGSLGYGSDSGTSGIIATASR